MQHTQPTRSIQTESSSSARYKLGTLLKIALALCLLLVIAAMVLPVCACGDVKKAKLLATKSQLATFTTALDMFKDDNGFFPSNLDELAIRPTGLAHWRQYMESIPLDPWGHPYIYKYPGAHGSNSFEIISAGPDWRLGTEDDIQTNR